MAYENDIIMRQVRDMTRMLAKILFGKNTATYEYKEEDRHTATDSLYARLIALVDAGKINEAENRLYEELERDEEGTFEVALGFYDYLNELPEEYAVTNWDQGKMSMGMLEQILKTLVTEYDVIGVDICGMYPEENSLPEYLRAERVNIRSDEELYRFLQKNLFCWASHK